ncbi:MAG: hypothetical protein HYU36_22130 [Planctomycetes bacterium]|nr:hypothetical protein [Planctomycetota bacterium]
MPYARENQKSSLLTAFPSCGEPRFLVDQTNDVRSGSEKWLVGSRKVCGGSRRGPFLRPSGGMTRREGLARPEASKSWGTIGRKRHVDTRQQWRAKRLFATSHFNEVNTVASQGLDDGCHDAIGESSQGASVVARGELASPDGEAKLLLAKILGRLDALVIEKAKR